MLAQTGAYLMGGLDTRPERVVVDVGMVGSFSREFGVVAAVCGISTERGVMERCSGDGIDICGEGGACGGSGLSGVVFCSCEEVVVWLSGCWLESGCGVVGIGITNSGASMLGNPVGTGRWSSVVGLMKPPGAGICPSVGLRSRSFSTQATLTRSIETVSSLFALWMVRCLSERRSIRNGPS